MAQVEFSYNGENTIIQCNLNEKMKDICQRFKEKAQVGNKNIFYSYDGKVGIKEESTFEESANTEDKRRKKMNVIVIESEILVPKEDIIKSKNIICPECKENINMDIKDYKINLYDCKNGHKIENILLNEYEETQNIDISKIICGICKKNNKSISYNNIFYKCLTCNYNICPLCKSNHDKEHKIMNYDDKYYICERHNENYISYCEECKINLCALCEGHKNLNRIFFADELPKKQELLKKKKRLKDTIYSINNEIKIIINILNEVMNKMNIYYKINEDIINNYDDDNKNRNYETIYYLNQFQNKNYIDELNSIIKCNNIKDKFNNIFNIYSKMNIDEITIIYKVKEKEIKLFGEDFVENNKNNCKLIINGKEQELKEKYYFGFFSPKKDFLEIKLKGISNITNLFRIFYDCSSLSSLPDISKLNTSNITNMSWMFYKCLSLSSLPDISKWNISNANNMSNMFQYCSSLSSLPDISKWNTSNVANMNSMFSECKSLLSLPDISKWNTSNVNDMSYMFYECSSLSSLPDISKWNTSNVKDMNCMFYQCKSLSSLPDISKWDISNVTKMSGMFNNCKDSLNIPSKFKI